MRVTTALPPNSEALYPRPTFEGQRDWDGGCHRAGPGSQGLLHKGVVGLRAALKWGTRGHGGGDSLGPGLELPLPVGLC